MKQNIIHNIDCLVGLKSLPDNCVDCCITSPPYYGLRDYGVAGQIGLEDTPDDYVQRLVKVFAEVNRVLKPTGTLWLNIGDSYAGSGKGFGGKQSYLCEGKNRNKAKTWDGIKAKDLIGIPWLLAFELRRFGWYLGRILFGISLTRCRKALPTVAQNRTSIFFYSANRQSIISTMR